MLTHTIPDDVWCLIGDLSGNPALAHVNGRLRNLLLGRWISAHVHSIGDVMLFDQWLNTAHHSSETVGLNITVRTSVIQRFMLPHNLSIHAGVIRFVVQQDINRDVMPDLLDELSGNFLAGWFSANNHVLHTLTLNLHGQSLCDEGFAHLWDAILGHMPFLRSCTLDVSGNGIGDEAFETDRLCRIHSPALWAGCGRTHHAVRPRRAVITSNWY